MKETKECSRLNEEKDRKGHQRGVKIRRMEEIGSKEKRMIRSQSVQILVKRRKHNRMWERRRKRESKEQRMVR